MLDTPLPGSELQRNAGLRPPGHEEGQTRHHAHNQQQHQHRQHGVLKTEKERRVMSLNVFSRCLPQTGKE